MTEYDKQSIEAILNGEGGWFTACLFRLIAKANAVNRARLYKGFPLEVEAVYKHLTGEPFKEDSK